jgi:hypothetical protein
MNNFVTREFRDGDMDRLQLHADQEILVSIAKGDQYKEELSALASRSLSRTFEVNGEVVAIFGIQQLWVGVGEAWLIPSVHLATFAKELCERVLMYFRGMDEKKMFTRLQTTVRSSDKKFRKFAELFGFTLECRMRCFEPDGTDAYMMGRVKEWPQQSQQ